MELGGIHIKFEWFAAFALWFYNLIATITGGRKKRQPLKIALLFYLRVTDEKITYKTKKPKKYAP